MCKMNLTEILEKVKYTSEKHYSIEQAKADIEKLFERKEILLKATYDILKKCDEGPYVKNVLETTAIWDEAECDGFCLMEEISEELGIEENV